MMTVTFFRDDYIFNSGYTGSPKKSSFYHHYWEGPGLKVLVCHGTAARPAASAVDSSGVAPFIVGFYRDILRRWGNGKGVLYLLKDSKPQAKPNTFSGNAKVHLDRN